MSDGLPPLDSDYQVLGSLGQGASSRVSRARELATGREVALKVLQPQTHLDSTQTQRFVREGQLAALLDHPGIVRVHRIGTFGGHPALVYELVEGARPFDEALRGLERVQAVRLLRDAARALGHAHKQGLVHRDVKGANLLVDPEGRVRVTDFGIATGLDLERLTRTGAVVGTPYAMAPEQVSGGAVEPSTDVWALGVLLYEALTGERPFDAPDLLQLAASILAGLEATPRSLDPSVPPKLEAVCLRALNLEPAERFPTGAELAAALDEVLVGSTSSGSSWQGPARNRTLAAILGAGSLVALVVAAVAWQALRAAAPAPDPAPTLPAPASPVVELTHPAAGAVLYETSLELRGVVKGGEGAALAVRVADQQQPVRNGVPFTMRLTLPVGEQSVSVQALVDESPRGDPVTVRIERREAPAWFLALPRSERPPLPGGVSPAETEGDYVNLRDDSLLKWIPPGPVHMRRRPEGRRHEVQLRRGVFMGKHEITWEKFLRFCQATGYPEAHVQGKKVAELPVSSLPWIAAQAYCAWAGLRLPNEAEWVRAASGPSGEANYPWGEDPLPRGNALFRRREASPPGTHSVDVSPFGCFDMGGNLSEWIADGDGPVTELYRVSLEPDESPHRLIKGGNFRYGSERAHVHTRSAVTANTLHTELGFRGCVSPSAPATPQPTWRVKSFRFGSSKVKGPPIWKDLSALGEAHTWQQLWFYSGFAAPRDARGSDGKLLFPPDVPRDGFALEATADVDLAPGTWWLSTTSDDGIQAWIDDVLVLDSWTHASSSWGPGHVATVNVPPGRHTVRVRYYENIGHAWLIVVLHGN